jgi:SAM-dependent methyltransferase
MKLESAKCYNCQSTAKKPYAEENGYSLVKCRDCGLIYIDIPPPASQIQQAHTQGLHSGSITINTTGQYQPAKIIRYLDALNNLFPDGLGDKKTWLDIGCGFGELLDAIKLVKGRDFRIRGSEPNSIKAQYARAMGHDVSFIELEDHKECYDVVSMLNVYSHLQDPPSFFEMISKNLNKHGELIIQTGDTADLNPEDHYRPFYLPDHLSFASERILVNILHRNKFKVERIKKYPFPLNPQKYPATDMYIRAIKIH